MKTVFLLFLAAFISGCDQAPEAPAPEAPVTKATPVRNAPQNTPIPIQPLTSAPAMPQTAPIPALISTRMATGTAGATATVSPAPRASEPSASPAAAAHSPSVTGS